MTWPARTVILSPRESSSLLTAATQLLIPHISRLPCQAFASVPRWWQGTLTFREGKFRPVAQLFPSWMGTAPLLETCCLWRRFARETKRNTRPFWRNRTQNTSRVLHPPSEHSFRGRRAGSQAAIVRARWRRHLSVSRQSLMKFGRGALQGGHVRKCMRRSRFRTNQRPKLPRPCRLRIGRVNEGVAGARLARRSLLLNRAWRRAPCIPAGCTELGCAAACWGCF